MNSTTITLNDFDITYYPGLTAQDVIPKLIANLKITFQNLPQDSIHYKAIKTYIRLLKNYLSISDIFSIQTTQTISIFNNLSEHLMNYALEKYPQYNIYISPQGRIKSPISANNKIKEKISKYLKEKQDLDTLTIKDFIAFRFIVEIRDYSENLVSEHISVDICYDIINEAINFINNYQSIYLLHISNRSKPQINNNVPSSIYHPLKRPKYIEKNDSLIKDFIYFPKPNTNYQSAHLQLAINFPNIDDSIFGEIQFRTFLMNEHAEKGYASHKKYKTRKKISYLAIPILLKPIQQFSQHVIFVEPDEAFKDFFGFSPKQINPFLSFDYLKNFLEESNYSSPVLPLYFKKDENNNIIFYDSSTELSTMPVEIMSSSNNTEQLIALIGDIFNEKIIEKETQELEFI